MKGKKTKATREPIGIVIAGIATPPAATVFTAYVWGPAPVSAEDEPSAS